MTYHQQGREGQFFSSCPGQRRVSRWKQADTFKSRSRAGEVVKQVRELWASLETRVPSSELARWRELAVTCPLTATCVP